MKKIIDTMNVREMASLEEAFKYAFTLPDGEGVLEELDGRISRLERVVSQLVISNGLTIEMVNLAAGYNRYREEGR